MGSIFLRGRVLWAKYRGLDGEWHNVSTDCYVGDEERARERLAALEAKVAAGIAPAAPLTVASYGRRWVEGRKARDIVSARDDASRLRLHVNPVLGDRRLEDVRPADIRDLVRSLVTAWRTKGKPAPRTIRNVYALLRAMFADAEADGFVTESPCRLRRGEVPGPEDADREWRDGAVFTRAELQTFLADPRVDEDRRIMAALMFLAGLRFGEAAALCWRHWDPSLEPLGRLTIAHAYSHRLKRMKAPKASKVRAVPVHPELAKILRDWKLSGWARWFGRPPRPDDLICPSRKLRDGALWPRHVSRGNQSFHEDLDTLGMRRRRQHDARRTFRSLCLSDGARRDLLDWVTHGRPGDIGGLYESPEWQAVCAEVAKLKITLEMGKIISLPARQAANADGALVQPVVQTQGGRENTPLLRASGMKGGGGADGIRTRG